MIVRKIKRSFPQENHISREQRPDNALYRIIIMRYNKLKSKKTKQHLNVVLIIYFIL